MRHILFCFCLVSFGFISRAQFVSQIDFNEVEDETKDSASQYFYPELLTKLRHADTLLNQKEYYYLYYGKVFLKAYYPYGTRPAKKSFLDDYDKGNYQEAYKKGKSALLDDPVDLEVLLKMSIVALKLEKDQEKRKYARHYYSFLDVIYGSGDGKSLSSAFVVTSVDHEYFIVGDLGLRVVEQKLIKDCDLLLFSKRDQKKVKGKKKIKRLYFNVRMPLMSLSKSFKDADLPDPDQEKN